jgi:hypothetical protein
LDSAEANKIDIKQLTPNEKERVLRILFAKINSQERGGKQFRSFENASSSAEDAEQKQQDRNFEAGAPFGLSVPLPKELEEPANYNLPSQDSEEQRHAASDQGDAGARLLNAIYDSRQQLEEQEQQQEQEDEERYSQDSYTEQNMLPDLA